MFQIEDQAVMRTYGFGDLYEQSHYYWEEIVGQTYLFKRRDLEVCSVCVCVCVLKMCDLSKSGLTSTPQILLF